MSFSAISEVTSKDLGNTLFLFQVADFMSLVNNDVKDWAAMNAYLDPKGVTSKGIQYALQAARNVSNAQAVAVGKANRPLISGDAHSITTMTALAKQLEVASVFDDDVYQRAKEDPSQIHVEPMLLEMHQQNVTSKENLVKQWYGDGTGVQATVASITAATPTGKATVVVSNSAAKRGTIRWIQVGQKVAFCAADGTKHDVEAASVSYYVVDSVDVAANSFIIIAKTAAGATASITGNGGGAPVAADDRVMNFGDLAQLTAFQDISGADLDLDKGLYAPGLAAHSKDDGSLLNGLALSGQFGGTRITASGALDPAAEITKLFEKLEDRNGIGEYVYPMLKCSPKIYRYAINADEDAVLLQPQQRERGGKVIKVAYGEMDTVLERCRFMPDYVMYAEPKKGSANSTMGTSLEPIQFKFSGFDFIKDPETGAIFRNKLSSGVRTAGWESQMRAFYTFVVLNHGAIGAISGYNIPS